MTTEERLERLEKTLGRSKRFNRWLLVSIGVAAGFWLSAGCLHSKPAWAQATGPGSDGSGLLRGKGLAIEDQNGKIRASLGLLEKDGPAMLRLYGENGKSNVRLCASNDDAWLCLSDESGEPRVTLQVSKYGPSLAMYGKKSGNRCVLNVGARGPQLSLFDMKGVIRAELSAPEEGPGLSLSDEHGNDRAVLGMVGTKSPDGTRVQHPESTLTLFNQENKVVWQSPK